jgi:hypothetical protein
MSLLPESAKRYIGVRSEIQTACDVVERGAVRRFAQAIMNEDPIFDVACENNRRYGGPVAPPLYPTHLFRRPFGSPDPIQLNARNPDFDGIDGAGSMWALPEIEPLQGLSIINGGTEIEFYRYARHGEAVTVNSRYADISERETSKGPIVLVVIESEHRTAQGELLVRVRFTAIRRK